MFELIIFRADFITKAVKEVIANKVKKKKKVFKINFNIKGPKCPSNIVNDYVFHTQHLNAFVDE